MTENNARASTAFDAVCDSIRRGRCVAFVGAGFTAGAVPTWSELIWNLAEHERVDAETRRDIERRMFAGGSAERRAFQNLSALELEGIAQIVRDTFDADDVAWEQAVREALARGGTPEGRSEVRERVALLRNIPFRAILTTNFDEYLPGEQPSGDVYRRILRQDHPWWNRDDLPDDDLADDAMPRLPVVHLHGAANGSAENPVVLHRAMYRERLYGDPRYAHFVRSVFASYDVLFLGVSFTDAYLNELRSEVLSFLYGHPERSSNEPPPRWGYAVVPDPTPSWARFLARHEGIEAIPYATAVVDRRTSHAGFKEVLARIEARTSAAGILRPHLEGQAVLWIDKNDQANAVGLQILHAAGARVLPRTLANVTDEELRCARLVLTNWTNKDDPQKPVPAVVLEKLRRVRQNRHAPVVVFGFVDDPERRREAIERGAWEYATGWSELFNVLCRLFDRRRTTTPAPGV
jgi:hypothetical protein